MSKDFKRTDYNRHLKLGKRRKKLQVWRRAKGRHSKIRKKRRSYPRMPTVGYKTSRSEHGKVNGFYPMLISNMQDLNKIGKNSAAIISSKIGAKKKIEIIKKAEDMKIRILNLGAKQ